MQVIRAREAVTEYGDKIFNLIKYSFECTFFIIIIAKKNFNWVRPIRKLIIIIFESGSFIIF